MPLNGSNAIDQLTAGVTAPEKVVTLDKNSKVDALDVTALSVNGVVVNPPAASRLAGATIVVGAEADPNINVTIQLLDGNGDALAYAAAVPWYLAGDAAGQTIGTAPSGGSAIGTDGLLIEWTANLAGLAISEADGDIDITFNEAGALTNYLVLVMPDGSLVISDAITHAA